MSHYEKFIKQTCQSGESLKANSCPFQIQIPDIAELLSVPNKQTDAKAFFFSFSNL